MDLIIGLRVSLQHEILGADLIEHAVGDIEYDKKTNSIINLRKNSHMTRADFADVDIQGENGDDSIPEFNQAHKRRRATILANSVEHVMEVNSIDRSNSLAAGQIPNNLALLSETSGEVYEMQIPIIKLHKQPNKKARMLWRYAAGSALNADNKARRKVATKNIKTIREKVEQVQSAKNNLDNSPKNKLFLKKKRSVDFDLNRNPSPSSSTAY